MEILATKKTLEYFNKQPKQSPPNEIFNRWAFILKKYNRRNLLVAMHVQTQYLVIFYGFRKPKVHEVEPFIYDLMRSFFEQKHISNHVIEQLLKPDELHFHTTGSKQLAGRLSRVVQDLVAFMDEVDPEVILQSKIMDEMNWIEGINYAQEDANSYFVSLEKEYPAPYHTPEALEITTELVLENYVVQRDFLVDKNMTLFDLHRLLQIGYQYSDSYTHSFYTLDQAGEVINEISNLEEYNNFIYVLQSGQENDYTLDDAFEEGTSLLYLYNFESNWEIIIKPGKLLFDFDKRLPICLLSTAEAPHESLGSEDDYDLYLQFIEQMIHPVFKRYFEQKPSFDLTSINRLIQKEMFR